MGLLEKAMHFKSMINEQGKDTLIDKIAGPADTDIITHDSSSVETKVEHITEDKFQNLDITNIDTDDLIDDIEMDIMDDSSDADDIDIDLSDEELKKLTEELGELKEMTNEDDFEDDLSDIIDEDIALEDESEEIDVPELSDEDVSAIKNDTNILESSNKSKSLNNDNSEDQNFELIKEITNAHTLHQLYDSLLFTVLGHLGSASASILVPTDKSLSHWYVEESRGISVDEKDIILQPHGLIEEIVQRKKITDIEIYKNKSSYQEDFYSLLAIDTRLIIPLIGDEKVAGILLLGNKLDSSPYTENDNKFLSMLSLMTGAKLHHLKSSSNRDIETGSTASGSILKAKKELDELFSTARDFMEVERFIQDFFKKQSLKHFAIFLFDETRNVYRTVLADQSDHFKLKENNFTLRESSSLITSQNFQDKRQRIENPSKSDVVLSSFGSEISHRIDDLSMFPVFSCGKLTGLICLFTEIENTEIRGQLNFLSPVIINGLEVFFQFDKNKNKYSDTIEKMLQRIEKSLESTMEINSTLTMILFSVKNYRRYYNLYGYGEAQKLFQHLESIISTRLDDVDFAFRYGRQEILVTMPGKNKKYAVSFANYVRNEMIKNFSKKEMQLLIPFFLAEYPTDGSDINTLLDSID